MLFIEGKLAENACSRPESSIIYIYVILLMNLRPVQVQLTTYCRKTTVEPSDRMVPTM